MGLWQHINTPLQDLSLAYIEELRFPRYSAMTVPRRTITMQVVSAAKLNAEFIAALISAEARRYSVHGFIQQPSFETKISSAFDRPERTGTPGDAAQPAEIESQSESDMEVDEAELVLSSQDRNELNSLLVKSQPQATNRPRNFAAYLDTPNVLATYRPSHLASPLRDDRVARIFCHFVHVTGPSISIYERQASNSPSAFNSISVPSSQKMLWSYLIPSLALQNTALLHAILALSAVHISKLQGTSDGPSLKHFTYAARRVGKLLGPSKQRHDAATLAAVLLLGFYEVLSADHSRWSLHLSGAKNLVMEIDYAGLARTVSRMRHRAKLNCAQNYCTTYEEVLQVADMPASLLSDADWEVDEDVLSLLSGLQIDYSNQWQPNLNHQEDYRDFGEAEVEDYKVKCDLRWWYCKQDIFQGMVSGDRLLMPYDFWKYCPPRGQIGKLQCAYATMDHLCIVMARLIDFGGKDRARKQRVIASQGGQWVPPPGFFPGSQNPSPKPDNDSTAKPSVDNTGRATANESKRRQQAGPGKLTVPAPAPITPLPGMFGMYPPPSEPIQRHSAVEMMEASLLESAFTKPLPPQHTADAQDLKTATQIALAEHAAITDAFETFVSLLPATFQPLPADSSLPITTPFGPALQYRTYTVACIWAFYYVGRILLHRLHPHMPPAAMISAGVTAHLTNEYAQLIGKISAGLYSPQQSNIQAGNLPPQLSAALIENTLFLLFAGVQYQDAAQRGWTISKLYDISTRTGWQSSASIAAACEVAWHTMGKAGRGPPYQPTMDRNNQDPRIRAAFEGRGSANSVSSASPSSEMKNEHTILSHDRDLIDRNASSRVHWALGLLSVEDDIAKLTVSN